MQPFNSSITDTNQENNTPLCNGCKQNRGTKTCGGCKSVVYCSKKCQTNHWKSHKTECKKIRKQQLKSSNKLKTKATNSSFASNLTKYYDKENKKQKQILKKSIDQQRPAKHDATKTNDTHQLHPPNNKIFFFNPGFFKFDKEAAELESMGFDPLHSRTALIKAKGDMNKAVEIMSKKAHRSNQHKLNDTTQDEQVCKHATCASVKRMVTSITCYHRNNIPDKVELREITDDFLHILSMHNGDEQYGTIYSKIMKNIGECDIKQCNIFSRNYRERNVSQDGYHKIKELYNSDETKDIVYQQILDKIHCHYLHSYDTGHRISPTEKISIENQIENIDDKLEPVVGLNNKLLVTNKIISPKCNQFLRSRSNKFMTSIIISTEETKVEDEHKDQFDKTYNFGVSFEYTNKDYGGHLVFPKYSSIKEEFISNPFSTLCIEQFNQEYEKAALKFNSLFCKQFISKTNKEVNHMMNMKKSVASQMGGVLADSELINCELSKQHLLALMIHCNYTELCYQFNKTYRKITKHETIESIIGRHGKFYFWAKTLKECVETFGTQVHGLTTKLFYHGISDQLLFSQMDYFDGLSVVCPMSTTDEFSVALSFNNHNKGVVVQFVDAGTSFGTFQFIRKRARYLDVQWLSDYTNESESLFVQSGFHLNFENIIVCNRGVELKPILQVIQLITDLVCQNVCHSGDINLAKLEREQPNISLVNFTAKILKEKVLHYPHSKMFDEYGKKLLDAYFAEQNRIVFKIELLNCDVYKSIFDIFYDSKSSLLKLYVLDSVFCNLETMTLQWDDVTQLMLENIMIYFGKQEKKNALKLIEITFTTYRNEPKLQMLVAYCKQHQLFNELDLDIYYYYKQPTRIVPSEILFNAGIVVQKIGYVWNKTQTNDVGFRMF
eukprot:309050_1